MNNVPSVSCPVCNKVIATREIEIHIDKCLLNTNAENDNSQSGSNSFKAKRIKYDSNRQQEISVRPSCIQNNDYHFPVPLADKYRPTSLSEYVGQEKVIGSNSILRTLLDRKQLQSIILWGPPGCGKTTLVNVIKKTLTQSDAKSMENINTRFVTVVGSQCGINEVKEIIKVAKNELSAWKRRTILFMDEIHRFNRMQQDVFLPHVENGTIVLLGATTENPSFSLTSALLSRCRVITLEKLTTKDIVEILHRVIKNTCMEVTSNEHPISLDHTESKNDRTCEIDEELIKWLADVSDGDARIAINGLQIAIQSRRAHRILLSDVKDSIKRSHMLYDSKGEQHYNLISALHKSIRASDDSAALYWLTRMLESGEDPIYIARRLVRFASEDIGIADSNALPLSVSAMTGCMQIGMPECDVLLAHVTVYLARAPKSREINDALSRAKSIVKEHKGPLPAVPLHLRNAPTKLMCDLGYGKNYNMMHKDISGLTYMPEGIGNFSFFSSQT